MRIVIDPTSLRETASVLRRAADTLGELCSLVGSAVNGVYAPPSVASYADSVTSSAASAIHNVIYELLDEAADLERRAAWCCAGESTSLPVPALVGMAFGGGAISAGSQVQMGSAVSPVAAFGPGLPESSVSGMAAFGPGVAMPAPVAAAPVAQPMSLQQVLGMGTFGGGSPVGSAITMVYDSTSVQAASVGVSPSVMRNMRPDLGVSVGVGIHNARLQAEIGRNMATLPIDVQYGPYRVVS
jgi:hypothetical protein